MITYKELEKEAMPPEKEKEAKQDWFAYYVGRKITYLITIPLLNTNISPNSITWLSILALIAGFIASCFATSTKIILLTWVLYFMWNLLDGVDGNIARYKKQYSPIGDILDSMGGYLAISFMYFSAGIIAAHTENFFDSIITYNKESLIILGALSSICGIFPRLIMHKIKSSYGAEATEEIQNKSSYSIIKIIALNISSVAGGSMVLFFVCIILKTLDVFTVIYFAMNATKMIVSIYLMLNKLKNKA